MQNVFVKIILVSLLAYVSNLDFQLAILFAIVLVLGSNLINGQGIFESYETIENKSLGIYHKDMTKYTDLLGKPAAIGTAKVIESQTDNYPGCNNVTINDLVDLFEGDRTKLQTTVHYAFRDLHQALPKEDKDKLLKIARAAGLPHNVDLIDENAPFIATLLLNYGYKITDSCQPPQ
jgi:hypothetical protein